MKKASLVAMAMLLVLTGCSGNSSKGQWDDIDYSRIARENQRRENDSSYTPPSVMGCVDDDLYNCNRR